MHRDCLFIVSRLCRNVSFDIALNNAEQTSKWSLKRYFATLEQIWSLGNYKKVVPPTQKGSSLWHQLRAIVVINTDLSLDIFTFI